MNNPYGFQLYNWHLEICSKCFLKCPRCIRQTNPDSFKEAELDLNFIKNNFTPKFLKDNVHRITFSGGVGDAIYNSQFLEIVHYLKNAHPDFQLVLVTNGSHRPKTFWAELSNYLTPIDEIIFSIDGLNDEMNNLYRIGSNFDSIMDAIEIMVKGPSVVRWQTIIFKFNQDHLEEIRNLAKKKGVDQFYLIKSGLFGSHINIYKDPETGIDLLEPDKHLVSEISRTQRLKEKFNKMTPNMRAYSKFFIEQYDPISTSHEDLTREKFKNFYIMPTCMFGYRGSYIDYRGFYYPCSWVSHPFKAITSIYDQNKSINYGQHFFKINQDKLNLNKFNLKEVLENPMWEELIRNWQKTDTQELVCEKKCLKDITSKSILGPKEYKK